MGCEPCKNFKCKYEHMKLIERVRELEAKKLDCDNCEKCQTLLDLLHNNECINSGMKALYEIEIKKLKADNEILGDSELKLQLALLGVSCALIGSLAVLVSILIGG